MKRDIFIAITMMIGSLGLAACGGSANNTNHANSTNHSAVNTAANTVGNAVNTVANTVANTAKSITTASPEDFMKAAAQGGMTEVELGKIAAKKAQDPEVKKFGQMMVDDHTKINAEMKELAAKQKVTLPADIGSNKSMVDDLNAKSGADFDKAYVDAMLDDHEEDVETFQNQAENSADADVKAFAAKTLPVLKKHLEAIKAIKAKMK